VLALEQAERPYRITCTVRGVNGILAAVRAGLGIAVMPRTLMPNDLTVVSPTAELPPLPDIDFILMPGPRAPSDAARALTTAILHSRNPLTP
jgi:DNA-binding transcriptional LysR family regulator